jgi:two-component system response regulator HydG
VSEKNKLVYRSKAMTEVMDAVEKIAGTNSTVLIRGETGTGKEVIARLIHEKSPRSGGAMVSVNCAAVPEALLESELFGHEKGAFTGAYKRKPGKFEVADGGTLFLDEIGEVPQAVQSKLLRAIEEKRFTRVGGVEPLEVDVRILAASNRDLEGEVQSGKFREDLYYRLAVVPLLVPPLRQRPEDIPELLGFFLSRFTAEMGKRLERFSQEAHEILGTYPWPGNVREIQNLVEQVVVMAEPDSRTVQVPDLPLRITDRHASSKAGILLESTLNLPEIIEQTEMACIERALKRSGWKKIEAARLLGVSRPTLDKKIKKYGIDVKRE